MTQQQIEDTRIQLAGLAMQGMIERESSWSSKIISDLMYDKIAKHCVRLADAVLRELMTTEFDKTHQDPDDSSFR